MEQSREGSQLLRTTKKLTLGKSPLTVFFGIV